MSEYREITDLPENPIKPGYYYHYKHDPQGLFNNYAYQVLGILRHTENRSLLMLYRPLYENTYLDVDFSGRPLEMAMDTVVVSGEEINRFEKINDPSIVKKLREIRDKMYPDSAAS